MTIPLEVHGVARKTDYEPVVTLVLAGNNIHIETKGLGGQKIGPDSARYLARKLYHLARKVEKHRAERAAETTPDAPAQESSQ